MREGRKECIICEKQIFRARCAGTSRPCRKSTDVTCSKKCSRIYQRVHRYVEGKIRRQIKGE